MEEKHFVIKWPDDYGPEWMNIDNLKMIMFSKEFIGGDAKDKVIVEIED